ncbi:MAG: PAS domain-containing sensor histidine kinase [Deltaproteobacteria bacterium]|nr:PAS domain-containing sensor histidine kinase [Deltaproteobacteria bacterium]
MMQARTPRAFGLAQRWTHVPLFFTLLTLVVFVRAAFGTGRLWLAALFVTSRAAILVVNFASDVSFNYSSISAVHAVHVLGATISCVEAEANPWVVLGPATGIAALAFVLDASIALWRRGDARNRQRAVTIGGGLLVWVALMMVSGAVTHAGRIHPPYFLSFSFLPVIGAASYELSRHILRPGRVSAKLHATEAELDLAVVAADLGVWAWEMRRDVISASPEARRMFGLSEDEPIDFPRFLEAVHPNDREAIQEAVRSAIRTGSDYQTEYRVGRIDDVAPRWIAARGRIERTRDGTPHRMRGVVFDVTARRRSDLETQELRDALAHSGRVNATGQLAATLAHELSQPLGAILRNAEAATLLLRDPDPDLDELRAIVTDIRADDARAANVIQRLRSLLARGRLDTRVLAVSQLVSGVVALLRAEAEARGIKLEIDIAPDVPPVRGDAVQLQQVVLNLVMNAMDATLETPSTLRSVVLGARAVEGGWVEVRVTDLGHGICSEVADRLFERFFTTKANGMGLGLPVSRTIVEAHGGSLTAGNNVGPGATFRFLLPAVIAEPGG